MRTRAISVVLLGLTVLGCSHPLGAVAPSTVPASPQTDLILFRAGDDASPSLWTVWGDGSHLARLRGIGLNEGGAVWSPDGTKIAFEHWLGLLPDIQVIEVASGTVWEITGRPLDDPAGWCCRVTWSPDGNTLYAATFADRIVSIDVSELANPGEPQLLTSAPEGVWEDFPACGPSGLVAYVSNNTDDGNVSIRVLDPGTGEDREAIGGVAQTPPDVPYGPLAWSPDSRYLAYRRYVAPWVADLCVAPVDGVLPNFGRAISPLDGWRPAWSRTGRYLYFASGGDLYRVKADGTSARLIVAGGLVEGNIIEPSVVQNPGFPPARQSDRASD